MKVFAMFLGLGAMLSLFFMYQQEERKNLLMLKLSADICWAGHYFFLSAYAGMIPNFVGIFRELIFVRRNEKSWANSLFWPLLIIIINWLLGFFTFKNIFNLLPIMASTAVTISLWIKNPKLTKIISIPVSSAFLIYDIKVDSWLGVINESIAIISIMLSFLKNNKNNTQGVKKMEQQNIFTADIATDKEPILIPGAKIENPVKILEATVEKSCKEKGAAFATEITQNFVSDFEKSGDQMAHVSTFLVQDGIIYMTYYANTKEPSENPENQTARFVYCSINDVENKVFFDIQTTGDICSGKVINCVYDTIMMQKDSNSIFIMWTARIDENYYRFYRIFTISDKKMSDVQVHKFKVGEIINDFSASGIKNALTANGIGYKSMYADIGIMQKLSSRMENGTRYYYSGAYSGDFTCIIKSKDLITWEYVAQPDFPNESMWENATYVKDNKCFYFVRQHNETQYGFLTVYNLEKKTWAKPILIADCQSRGDFIEYQGNLYLFHAPIDRCHIGIVRIDTDNIENSKIILQAHMHTSCFYPFIQYFQNDELAMSYTIARKHIRLAKFDLKKYLD